MARMRCDEEENRDPRKRRQNKLLRAFLSVLRLAKIPSGVRGVGRKGKDEQVLSFTGWMREGIHVTIDSIGAWPLRSDEEYKQVSFTVSIHIIRT